jgi:hypothetical protein
MHLRIARNPDSGSRLPYLLHVPLGTGLVFRTSGLWPRTNALYCHPVPLSEWPEQPEFVEEAPLRSGVRRGAAIDLVLDRARENRSQLVYTAARGREVVFWQSPRTRKQARPNVRTPTARAAGIPELHIIIDAREQYPYRFAGQQVRPSRRALPAGDYGLEVDGRLVAAVERKSLADLTSSLVSGKLRFAVADLAALPRGAVVVEDRYSQVFHAQHVRPALVADGLAELQVRWPEVPIVFCETRSLAEEWIYRYLAAAYAWASTESGTAERIGPVVSEVDDAPPGPGTVHCGGLRLGPAAGSARTRPEPPRPRHLVRRASGPHLNSGRTGGIGVAPTAPMPPDPANLAIRGTPSSAGDRGRRSTVVPVNHRCSESTDSRASSSSSVKDRASPRRRGPRSR